MEPQGNPGQFMNPGGQGQQGAGSALMRLMQLRQQGASPQAASANTQNPQAVPPATPPPMGGGGAMTGDLSGQQMQTPQTTFTNPDNNLQLALQALGNYVKAHSEGHMADKGVHMAKANGKVRESQAQPQTAPVS